jgi:hypothetical protein
MEDLFSGAPGRNTICDTRLRKTRTPLAGARLGLGYWLMMVGTALIFVGALGVVVADQFARRSTSTAASSDRNPETLESDPSQCHDQNKCTLQPSGEWTSTGLRSSFISAAPLETR